MNKIMAFLTGALVGAAVGAAAALLLTPASGQELQDQTRDWVDTLVSDARRAADAKRAELEAQLNALKQPQPAAGPASTPDRAPTPVG
jgi:gas vesicle protein